MFLATPGDVPSLTGMKTVSQCSARPQRRIYRLRYVAAPSRRLTRAHHSRGACELWLGTDPCLFFSLRPTCHAIVPCVGVWPLMSMKSRNKLCLAPGLAADELELTKYIRRAPILRAGQIAAGANSHASAAESGMPAALPARTARLLYARLSCVAARGHARAATVADSRAWAARVHRLIIARIAARLSLQCYATHRVLDVFESLCVRSFAVCAVCCNGSSASCADHRCWPHACMAA